VPSPSAPSAGAAGGSAPFRRVIAHMVFADVKGYSKLKEEQLPYFVSQFLRSVSLQRGVGVFVSLPHLSNPA
jgi:hypothetical protein